MQDFNLSLSIPFRILKHFIPKPSTLVMKAVIFNLNQTCSTRLRYRRMQENCCFSLWLYIDSIRFRRRLYHQNFEPSLCVLFPLNSLSFWVNWCSQPILDFWLPFASEIHSLAYINKINIYLIVVNPSLTVLSALIRSNLCSEHFTHVLPCKCICFF